MNIREKRCLFTACMAKLIIWANEQGYQTAIAEVRRSPEQAKANEASGAGISNSLHLLALAGDVDLYRDGLWLSKSEDHKRLGEYWKSLHPLCRWGGDFRDSQGRPKPDGNHYSIEHEGRK